MRVMDLRRRQPLERPGKIQNAEGGVNEADTANQPARWCDFSGPVGEGWSGLALMDHPDNPVHPAVFSTRDYGVFSFKQYFPAELPENALLTLRGCAYIHGGDAEKGRVEEMYQRWVAGE